MDTGLNIRPVEPKTSVAVWTEVATQRAAARTELPATQVVNAVAETEAVQFNQNGREQVVRAKLNRVIDAMAERSTMKVEQDEITRDIVFRKVNPETGAVVQQFPDEAVLRQRAYAVQQRRAELQMELMPSSNSEEHVSKVA